MFLEDSSEFSAWRREWEADRESDQWVSEHESLLPIFPPMPVLACADEFPRHAACVEQDRFGFSSEGLPRLLTVISIVSSWHIADTGMLICGDCKIAICC